MKALYLVVSDKMFLKLHFLNLLFDPITYAINQNSSNNLVEDHP